MTINPLDYINYKTKDGFMMKMDLAVHEPQYIPDWFRPMPDPIEYIPQNVNKNKPKKKTYNVKIIGNIYDKKP